MEKYRKNLGRTEYCYLVNSNYKKSSYYLYSGLSSLNKIIGKTDSQYIIVVNTLLIFKNN